MHKLFQNRFLGTASFLCTPDEPAGGGQQQQDDGNGSDTNDDAGGDSGAAAGQDAGAAGDDQGGDGAGDGDPDDKPAAGADDEDDDLGDLTPEQRAKVEARLARETGWRDRQIDRLYAKRRSAEADVEAAGAIVQRQPGAENLTPTQIEERARELAKTMTAQQTYDEACNTAFAEGRKQFEGKWDGALAKLPKLGGVEVPDMQNIMATEQPHVVLFQLSNPEVYERVMALPPARRFAEFVKLSLKQFPKPTSGKDSKRPGDAPLPPRSINGSGRRVAAQTVDLADPNVSDEAWYAARNAQRRKKFSNAE